MNVHGIGTKQYTDVKELIDDWRSKYNYRRPKLYDDNIDKGLDSKRYFQKLFIWKNGRALSKSKQELINGFWKKKKVLLSLRNSSSLDQFQIAFNLSESACIWKTFLLHIVRPDKYPIYDQHVYRAYMFIDTGQIQEIPASSKQKYDHYLNHYLPWFDGVRKANPSNTVKQIDEALFAYGKALKVISKLPSQVYA